jgi:hypothetical protein
MKTSHDALGEETQLYPRNSYATSSPEVLGFTVGGDTQQRSLQVLKPGGILVSVVSPVSEKAQKRYGIRAAYFYVDVNTTRLNKITELFESGKLTTDVGTVLPLEEARKAHEMLGGAPHRRGKIVLNIAARRRGSRPPDLIDTRAIADDGGSVAGRADFDHAAGTPELCGVGQNGNQDRLHSCRSFTERRIPVHR